MALLFFSIPAFSQGMERPNSPKRSNSTSLVEIHENGTNLELLFGEDLGQVTVSFTDEDGRVFYRSTTHAVVGMSLAINISRWPVQLYILRVTDNKGGVIKEIALYL